ncbi:hypothetical protein FJZ48_03065, partial [Candidatus Uhrbacteria bacterium]|nr:hypothetical protein [Candidatus Uhrbacteria bacterium]
MKIAFVGGGTLGPVTPLLAVARSIKRLAPQTKCFWIGTPSGPEKSLVEAEGIPFFSLPVFKFPRYVSLAWFTLPFRWFRVRSMATTLIEEQKPDAIVGMGGYTSVPVMRAARQTAIPCFTHQLDLLPLLSNRLIAKKCVSVTTSFEYEQRPFGPNVLDEPIATPSRFSLSDLPSRAEAIKFFHLHERKPVVFMFGGGTGAQAMNEMLERTWSAWHKMAQVIHLTGTGKKGVIHADVSAEIFDQEHMLHAYAAADIVIARAGIGTLSEVAALKKPVILIPLPSAHQEANARAFEEQGAALVI